MYSKQLALIGLVCCLLWLGGCSTNRTNVHTISVNRQSLTTFLAVESGTGADLETAKARALNALAQDIFVEVQGATTSTESLEDNNFKVSASDNVSTKSNGYFREIEFFNTKRISSNAVEVEAGLSERALLATIQYLNELLRGRDLLDSLVFTELQEEYSRVNFLLALIDYAKAKSNRTSEEVNSKLTDLKLYQQNVKNHLYADANVTFNTMPVSANAVVRLNNRTYKPREKIFLAQGNYAFSIDAPLFKSVKRSLKLTRGDSVSLNIYLQKKLLSPLAVLIQLHTSNMVNSADLLQSVKNLLPAYQLTEANAPAATNKILEITILPAVKSMLAGTTYLRIPISVSLKYKGHVKFSETSQLITVQSSSNGSFSEIAIVTKIKQALDSLTAGNNLREAFCS